MKLPDPAIRQEQWNRNSDGEITSKAPDFTAYTAAQMRQYRLDALEEAAQMCLSMLYCDFKGNPLQYGPVIEVNEVIRDCATAIQSLKEKKHE